MLMPLAQAQRARFAPRATWLSVVGLLLVPLVVGGLLTWALWDPTDRLDRVNAAIVNADEPVEVNGQIVPLGRQLAAALVTGQGTTDTDTETGTDTDTGATSDEVPNVSGTGVTTTFDWVLSDASDAEAGLADGRYDVVLTIPANFSAAATSFSGDPADAEQATFEVTTSTRARPMDGAIAQALAITAADALGTQLTESYLSTVLVSFTTLHDELGTAADGATQLASGAGELSSGTGEIASGASQLSGGLTDLSDGSYQLSAGLTRLADGAGSLSSGLSDLSSGTGDLASGLQLSSAGASDLADGLGQVADQTAASADQAAAGVADAQLFAAGLSQSSAGATDLAAGTAQLAASATQLDGGLQLLYSNLLGLAAQCAGGADPVACATLQATLEAPQTAQLFAGVTQLSAGLGQTDAGAQQLAAGLVPLAAGGQELADGAQASADGLTQLSGALGQLADGADQLASGTAQAAGGAQQLADGAALSASGASELAGGAQSSASGAGQIAAGQSEAASGAGDLADGATQVADGATQLADGVDQLAGGLTEATDQIPTYTDGEATSLAAVVASPVTAQETSTPLGSASVPVLVALALWLGAMATYLVLTPLGREALGSPRSSTRLAWQALWPAAGIGVGQALVLSTVMTVALELSFGQASAFFALAVLAAVALTAVNQGLAALLGGVGRFVAVVVAVVTLATGVISTAPALLTGLAAVLPTAPVVDGLRAVVQDESGAFGAGVALALWGAAGFAAAIGAIARKRVVEVGRLARWARA